MIDAKPTPTSIIANLVIAQALGLSSLHVANAAMTYAYKHDLDTMPARERVAICADHLHKLEVLRVQHTRYIPALTKLDGWHRALYEDGLPE